MPATFKFLQFSDVLLDSKLTVSAQLPMQGGFNCGYSLPKAERQERAREILETTINAFALAAQEEVDAILIPGGLFESATVSGYTINTLIESISTIEHIPVFIAPGLADLYTRSSLYALDMLQARGLKTWPSNVHIFTSEHFSAVPLPGKPHVSICGRAITKGSRRSERAISSRLPKGHGSVINICMLAGSLESHPQLEMQERKSLIFPFSVQDMADQKMTYFALGGTADAYKVDDNNGNTLGAYAGCLASGTFEKLGARVALLGEIVVDEAGSQVELTPREIDERRMMLVSVDVSGLGDSDIKEEIVVQVEEAGVRPETDVVALNLEGGYKPGANPRKIAEVLSEQFYCMQVIDNTRPDYLAERFDERTTEWKYIQAMLEMKTKAQKQTDNLVEASLSSDSLSGIPGADLSGKTVEDALYYGLDALRQKRVSIRNVG